MTESISVQLTADAAGLTWVVSKDGRDNLLNIECI